MLAGVRPDTTTAGDYLDALWWAWCELAGPGDHIFDVWADLTGESLEGAATSEDFERARDSADGQARAASSAALNLSEEDLEAWVPAFSGDLSDEEYDRQLVYWQHTAKKAAGQSALVRFAGGGRDGAASAGATPSLGTDEPGGGS